MTFAHVPHFDSAIHYAHFNELGHLLALTDENGAVTDQFAYHPYGRLVARTGTTDTPFLYMGAHGVMRAGYDLYLTRHRAYSANLMRFIQSDPLGLDGGLNLYAYAGGNAVFFVDVLGLARMSPELAFAPRSDNLMSETELRAYQSQQQQAQTFLRGLGANAASPQLAQQVSWDLLMALPGAAVGCMVDDAVRGIVGVVRGGSVAAGVGKSTTWNPLNGPGPLGEKVAGTFRSATYTEMVTSDATTLYRAYGGNSPQIGPYWTRTPTAGPLQSTIDSALNPVWGNTANNAVKIQVPAGTRIFEGVAAPQGGLVGGGNQIYIPIKNVNPSWIVP